MSLSAAQRQGIEAALRRCGVDVTAKMVNEVATAVEDAARDHTAPRLLGWTWRAHLDDLDDDVKDKQWLRVSKKLALMLGYALDEVREKENS